LSDYSIMVAEMQHILCRKGKILVLFID